MEVVDVRVDGDRSLLVNVTLAGKSSVLGRAEAVAIRAVLGLLGDLDSLLRRRRRVAAHRSDAVAKGVERSLNVVEHLLLRSRGQSRFSSGTSSSSVLTRSMRHWRRPLETRLSDCQIRLKQPACGIESRGQLPPSTRSALPELAHLISRLDPLGVQHQLLQHVFDLSLTQRRSPPRSRFKLLERFLLPLLRDLLVLGLAPSPAWSKWCTRELACRSRACCKCCQWRRR